VQRLVGYFRERGADDVSELEVVEEDVRFMMPKEIRRSAPSAA
jgi:4-hydroxy-3-methylbut-2-enyl diphosphate reductase